MTIPKNRHMSRSEEFTLGRFMEPIVKKLSDKTVEYAEGWTDERVLAECGIEKIGLGHVANFRTSVFGRLKTTPMNNPVAVAHEKIRSLEQRVTALEEAMTKPKINHLLGILQNGDGSSQQSKYQR